MFQMHNIFYNFWNFGFFRNYYNYDNYITWFLNNVFNHVYHHFSVIEINKWNNKWNIYHLKSILFFVGSF